ncbi:MAG: hypothetical protein V2A79_19040 [Planctomycetota bacterium]
MNEKPRYWSCKEEDQYLSHHDRDEAILYYLDGLGRTKPASITVYGYGSMLEAEREFDEADEWEYEVICHEDVDVAAWVREHRPDWIRDGVAVERDGCQCEKID